MRVHVRVIDDKGKVFEGDADLHAVSRKSNVKGEASWKTPRSKAKLDFSLSHRAFMKLYAKDLSGAQKFTLLLAKLTAGKVQTEKTRKDIEKEWNRMKALMGGEFNPAHTTRAKDNGWVDTPKKGSYVLLPRWSEAVG